VVVFPRRYRRAAHRGGAAKANAALADADRRKDEFVAVLSHELRNRRATAVIERQVAHVVRLVDDLLDLSRIATGKIELRRDLFTLGSIVSTAVEADTRRPFRVLMRRAP
jgi:signal transduction histidine kinase